MKQKVPVKKLRRTATLREQPVRHRDVIDKDEILSYVLEKVES